MTMAVLRFNCIQPGLEPTEMSARYQAFVEMAVLGDKSGFAMVNLEEHHGAENGWSPSPMLMAGMVMAQTKDIRLNFGALLLPLHDPIRAAEDLAVLDLVSGGRVSTVAGLGYRPSEYHLHGKDWAGRGKLMDHCVDTVLKAWTGEPFEYNGEMVQVTPTPLTKPHPVLMIGGTSKATARRAARFGLPMYTAAPVPEIEKLYYEECERLGVKGFCVMPQGMSVHLFVVDDPDAAWAAYGKHVWHEASTYAGWQTSDISSAAHSHASNVEELREEGMYRFVTPSEAIEQVRASRTAILHPLCGGMPLDAAWDMYQRFLDDVWPQVRKP
jgi:alkanesulfonate monooxygenase SsuD/methylene tetrahydromethanopterin reductase-like flavin-dependent oxidoreductase (luciferase family)